MLGAKASRMLSMFGSCTMVVGDGMANTTAGLEGVDLLPACLCATPAGDLWPMREKEPEEEDDAAEDEAGVAVAARGEANIELRSAAAKDGAANDGAGIGAANGEVEAGGTPNDDALKENMGAAGPASTDAAAEDGAVNGFTAAITGTAGSLEASDCKLSWESCCVAASCDMARSID